MGSSADVLDLQAAADELGVHYQTAYRWVRTGRLQAQIAGGRYVVAREDLAALERARRTPRTPPAPGEKRIARAADRVHDALVAGDEVAVGRIAHRLVGEGTRLSALIQEVFVPALRRIGQAWHDGKLAIRVEHRASAIVERILGELSPNPRGRRRGTAVVAALSGEQHSLPTTMATVALREDHWHVQHLGVNVPPGEIKAFCDEHDVDVVVLSVTGPDTAVLARTTARQLRAVGTPTLVGGPGRTLDDLLDEARNTGS